MAEINGVSVPFIPISNNENFGKPQIDKAGNSFETIFQRELDKIKFSNHAVKRLETRNIQLSDEEINKIQNAVEKAQQKGSKDSLVMMSDTAFIVNIPNKTVVTALPVSQGEDNIFTNIDSVVFA